MVKPAGRRILVVEDEMMIALMMEDILAALGFQFAGRAHTVATALAIIETDAQGIDAVTLDLNLGGERSDAVADALEAHGIPFIVMTGYAESDTSARFDGRPVVRKPFLRGQVEEALLSLELSR